MDIPVMPHPGTDTQTSPYQSRQMMLTTGDEGDVEVDGTTPLQYRQK